MGTKWDVLRRSERNDGMYYIQSYKIKIFVPDDRRARPRVWIWSAERKFFVEQLDQKARTTVQALFHDISAAAVGHARKAKQAPSYTIEPAEPRYIVPWQSIDRSNRNSEWIARKPEFTKRSARAKIAAARGQRNNKQRQGS